MRFIIIILAFSGLQAQEDVVSWKAVLDIDNSVIKIEAEMKDDWVIYSQHTAPDGPIPLEFEFEQAEGVEFIGKVLELSEPISNMSELFGVEVKKFKNSANFSQKVNLDIKPKFLRANVTYMTCDSRRCLPPRTVVFEVKI